MDVGMILNLNLIKEIGIGVHATKILLDNLNAMGVSLLKMLY
jgi:hypothetical protein